MLSQVVDDVEMVGAQPLEIHITEALVVRELSSVELPLADLALYDDLGALSFDVLEQLSPGHVLVVLVIANIAAKLRALVHRVLLQLGHGLPNDFLFSSIPPALVWELAKVNTIAKNFVDRL